MGQKFHCFAVVNNTMKFNFSKKVKGTYVDMHTVRSSISSQACSRKLISANLRVPRQNMKFYPHKLFWPCSTHRFDILKMTYSVLDLSKQVNDHFMIINFFIVCEHSK